MSNDRNIESFKQKTLNLNDVKYSNCNHDGLSRQIVQIGNCIWLAAFARYDARRKTIRGPATTSTSRDITTSAG